MNQFELFLFYITLWCCNKTSEVQSTKQKALIFNPLKKQLLDINPEDEDPSMSLPYITACPASSNSEEETIFNQYASVTKHSLFLKQIYSEGVFARYIELSVCDQTPKPQLVYNDSTDAFQFGYEVGKSILFYQKEKVFLECDYYDELRPVQDVFQKEPLNNPNPNKKYIIAENHENNTFFKIRSEEWRKAIVYYWINVLSIDVDISNHYRVLTFTKDSAKNYSNGSRTMLYCEMYYFENGMTLDNEDLKVGDTTEDENPDTTKEQIVARLEKTQILPMRMLHTFAAKLATCLYLNFAFIWNTIANEQLNEVDLFLYAMYQIWPSETELYFGVSGKSRSIDPDSRQEIESEDENFLKFPIPRIIHRVIKYTVQNKIYHVVIIIHNDTNFIKENDRLCAPDPELESWDVIESKDTTSGTTYACKLTFDIIDKTGYLKGRPISSLLKLNEFPELNPSENKITYRNVLKDICKKRDFIKNNR